MADLGGLESFRGLHQDLIALQSAQLRTIDKLHADLKVQVNAFRRLLDKPAKNSESRTAVKSGKTIEL